MFVKITEKNKTVQVYLDEIAYKMHEDFLTYKSHEDFLTLKICEDFLKTVQIQ